MSEQSRDHLRKELRSLRSSLDADQIKQHSQSICTRASTLIADAKHIAGYYALGAEVDLSLLLSVFAQQDKTAYVPMVLPDFRMAFAPVDGHTPTVLNRYGIKEPQVDDALYKSALQLDAVLVPLVGFDENCNRMGMGGGYYDRCFAHRLKTDKQPVLIGVAYEMQCVPTVYEQSWDVPLDFVVTESRILSREK